MNHASIEAIRGLVSAYELGRVYGPDHARCVEQLRRCLDACAASLAEQQTLSIVIAAQGLVVNQRTLHESWARDALLLQKLRDRGIEAIRISERVDLADVQWLLRAAEARDAATSPSGRIVLGKIKANDHAGQVASTTSTAAAPVVAATPMRASLQSAWNNVLARNDDLNAVAMLVNQIMSATVFNRAGLIKLADLKSHDEYTFIHVTNVAILSSALGESVGLRSDTLRDLTEAALLHDIGKWTLPRHILSKPGALSDEERRTMQLHPVMGAKILALSRGISDLAIVAALEHHQRIDGKGYPAVPHGRWPSLLSQVVQVADIFDALRSDRPYRDGLPVEKCLEIMSKDAGAAFDRALFEAFQQSVLRRIVVTPPGAQAQVSPQAAA